MGGKKCLKGSGVYKPTTNEVWVDLNHPDWYATPLELINHELIHSVTYDGINSGKYTDRIKAIQAHIGDALKYEVIEPDDDGIIPERLMYAYGSPHELLTVTFAETQIRAALPKDIITDLNQLFTDITGESNGRPTSTNTSRDDRSSQEILSGRSKPTSTGQSTGDSGDGNTSQDEARDSSVDETSIRENTQSKEQEQITYGTTKDNPIRVYVDGSDIKGTGQIGYGAYAQYNDSTYELSGTNDSAAVLELSNKFPNAKFSNPTMEMLGLVETLKQFANTAEHIVIHQDYKGAVNYNGLWDKSIGSVQRDPKAWNAKEPYIKHLVAQAEAYISQIEANGGSVQISWVKGHQTGNSPHKFGNDNADRMAKSRNEVNTFKQPVSQNQEQRQVTYNLTQLRKSIDKLASDKFTGLTEFIYDAITTFNPDVKVVMRDETVVVSDNTVVPASYDANTNTITIYTPIFNGLDTDNKTSVILHELIHALTEQSLKDDASPALKKQAEILKTMRNQLMTVWQDNQHSYTFSMNTRLNNMLNAPLGEFIAYGLTDPDMAGWINDNLITDKPIKAKRGFGNYIKHFLKTVYDAWFKRTNTKRTRSFDSFVKVSQQLFSEYTPSDNRVYAQTIIDEANDVDVVELFKNQNKGRITDEHDKRLDSLINTFIGVYYKHTGNKSLVNLAQGKVKNTSLISGLASSDKEAHVTEALAAIFKVYLKEQGGTLAVNGIDKLYRQAQAQFKSAKDLFSDYDSKSADDKARLKAIHGFAFNKKNDDSLAWFLALAVSNEEFGQVLAGHTIKAEKSDSSWFDKIMGVLEEMVNVLNGWFFKAKGKSAKDKIDAYVNALAILETKARNKEADKIQKSYTWLHQGIYGLADKPVRMMTYHATRRMSEMKFLPAPIRALANVQFTALRLDYTNREIPESNIESQLLSELFKDRYDVIADTINEVIGYGIRGQLIDRMTRVTKAVEQHRQSIHDNTHKAIKSFFNKELSQQDKDNISYVILRTDMASLLNHGFKAKDILALLDDKKRMALIKDYENKLITQMGENANDMLHQVYALSLYMATGKTRANLIKSAEGIAIGLGSSYQTTFDKMDSEVYETVDVLASLLALSMVNHHERNHVARMVKDDADGLTKILHLHQSLIEKGKADFIHNPYNYQKGYLPEMVNPSRKVIYANLDDVEQYQNKGFDVIDVLTQDEADDTGVRVLMVHDDYEPYNWVSGALEMADTHHRGTPIYQQGIDDKAIHDVITTHLATRQHLARRRPVFEEYVKSSGSTLIPTYDTSGAILDYHYEMSHEVRDKLLERDNSFDELLATLSASVEFKPERTKQQQNIAKAIHADVKANYAKRPSDYVILNFESTDPQIRKMVRMIPYPFRAELQRLYGKNAKGYPIHKAMFTATFGYQAYSIVRIWDKLDTNTKLNWAEKLIRMAFTFFYQSKARQRAMQAERLIQDTMSLIKDLIVVRSGGVLMGNIYANIILLMHRGINPIRILKDTTFAWRNAKIYRSAVNRMAEIDALLQSTRTSQEKSHLVRERKVLEESIERNPLKAYMKAGLMSTIVEDLTQKEDSKYKIPLQQKVDDYAELIPKPIRRVFNEVTVNDGSYVHTLLSEATQFSDFAAKYTLAKYLEDDGMTTNKAIYEAQMSFINYDIPTNIYLDYANRVGLMMFTKFFLRFQRNLVKMSLNAPVTTIMGHYGVEMMGGQGLLDPFVLNRLGNPLDESVLNLYSAFDNTLGLGMLI